MKRERKEFRAGHTKEARVENPAETSAPDPERADEMLVLRCPPCHRQASDTFVLSLLHSTRNGQIEPDKKLTPTVACITGSGRNVLRHQNPKTQSRHG